MRPIYTLLLVLFLSACATSEPLAPEPKTYSQETLKTFEEIEREQVLEYYRQLREREMNAQKRQAPPPPAPKKLEQFHTQKPKPKPVPRPAVQAGDPVEIEKEIEQNLTFFCMRTRNDARFSEQGSCERHTREVFENCKNDFEENDRRRVQCVKNKLR